MKSSIVVASALVSMALAVPAIKRDIATEVVYEYVTVTVTGTGPSPTAVAPSSDAGAFYAASSEEAPTPEPSPEPAPYAQPDYSGVDDYAKGFLEQHNIHRANHSAPAVTWDPTLATIANTIASTCKYGHDTSVGGISYGQNIGAASDESGAGAASVITNSMYNGEMPKYTAYGGEPNDGNFGSWGHFTQIVWKSTTSIGCATASCPGGLAGAGGMNYFTVCNYAPAGNFGGRYADNVLAPLGQASS